MTRNMNVKHHSRPMVEFTKERFDIAKGKEPERKEPTLLERFCYSLTCRTLRQWIRYVAIKSAHVYVCSGCLKTREFAEAGWTDDERGISHVQVIINSASEKLEKLRQEAREKMRKWRAEHPAGYKARRAPGHKHRGVCGARCFA